MPLARIERIGEMTGFDVLVITLGRRLRTCRMCRCRTDAVGVGDKSLNDGVEAIVELTAGEARHQI